MPGNQLRAAERLLLKGHKCGPRESSGPIQIQSCKEGEGWKPATKNLQPCDHFQGYDGTDFKCKTASHCKHRGKLEAEKEQDFIW